MNTYTKINVLSSNSTGEIKKERSFCILSIVAPPSINE
jgi:hypothetical protein